MNKQTIFEQVIEKYMKALASYDLDGLCSLFAPNAKVYSPLLGWIKPRIFFEKMYTASDFFKMLKNVGLQIENIFSDNLQPYNKNLPTMIFVGKKISI